MTWVGWTQRRELIEIQTKRAREFEGSLWRPRTTGQRRRFFPLAPFEQWVATVISARCFCDWWVKQKGQSGGKSGEGQKKKRARRKRVGWLAADVIMSASAGNSNRCCYLIKAALGHDVNDVHYNGCDTTGRPPPAYPAPSQTDDTATTINSMQDFQMANRSIKVFGMLYTAKPPEMLKRQRSWRLLYLIRTARIVMVNL